MRTLVGPQPSPGASDAKGLNPYSEALNALDRKNQQGESKRASESVGFGPNVRSSSASCFSSRVAVLVWSIWISLGRACPKLLFQAYPSSPLPAGGAGCPGRKSQLDTRSSSIFAIRAARRDADVKPCKCCFQQADRPRSPHSEGLRGLLVGRRGAPLENP